MRHIRFFASAFWALFAFLFLFSACKQDHSKHKAAESVASATAGGYICPMNCEKGKVYPQPGSCPVCKMDLEAVKAEVQANKAEYYTAFAANPAVTEAGKAGVLSFTPKIKGDESAAVPLDLVHEKKMHLIFVSDDLSWFDHLHPEYSSAGTYDIQLLPKGTAYTKGPGHNESRLEAGGKYWAFADFKPVGGLNQVNKIEIDVQGPTRKPFLYDAASTQASVDGFTLKMDTGHTGGGLVTGSEQHLPVTITRNGKAVDAGTFEQYLGEKAHLILIETASKEFVHTHPSVVNGQLDIHTTFAKPGIYRAWLQFQTDGKVHTAAFVLPVAQGTGTTPSSDMPHSGH